MGLLSFRSLRDGRVRMPATIRSGLVDFRDKTMMPVARHADRLIRVAYTS